MWPVYATSRVRYVDPRNWRCVLLLAAAGGAGVGLTDPVLRWAAESVRQSPETGTWVSVAGLLTALCVLLAWWYPDRRVGTAAAILAGVAFSLSAATMHGLVLGRWTFRTLLLDLASVMWVAVLGYVGLVWLTILLVGPMRRVGVAPGPRCDRCGYLLIGLTEARCPECGHPFDARLLPVVPDASIER